MASLRSAAETVLKDYTDGRPLHFREITKTALEKGLISPKGLTPEASMAAALSTDVKKGGEKGAGPRFRAYGRGLYGLNTATDSAQRAVQQQNESVRKRLREALSSMEPKAFENLIGQLLESIGFEDVEVTKYQGDGGIDVRGRLAVGGVTNVQTAIQVKRWANNVPDKIVRELRGGLSTQERGLIITLSDFTAAARTEAEKSDRVPISLVNGHELVELLIGSEIGVTPKQVAVLELDEGALEIDDEDSGDEDDYGLLSISKPTVKTSKTLSLWPLPGGRKNWKATLKAMLKQVSRNQPTLQEAALWLVESFESMASEKGARGYWKVPRQMGLVELSGEQLSLTPVGAKYLADENDAYLLDHLLATIAGFSEILNRLEQGPATEEELWDFLKEKLGVTWERVAQVHYRCGWLENLGKARKQGSKWQLATLPRC
ncbi:MAG: restriction endonuclease [Actinomycetota bacterium]